MPLWGIYGGMLLFTALLGGWGISGFNKRVQT
jgi:hypothetical protein